MEANGNKENKMTWKDLKGGENDILFSISVQPVGVLEAKRKGR